MKKTLLFTCVLMLAVGQAFSQIWVYEPFDYSPTGASLLDGSYTNAVTNTTWTDRQGGDDDMLIETDPGWGSDPDIANQAFDLNPTGNAVHFQGGGEDGVLPFAAPLNAGSAGTVYLSFLIDIVGWDATATNNPSDYRLVHFGVDNGSGGYNAGTGLFIGPGVSDPANTFRLGYCNSDASSDVVWGPTDYNFTDLGAEEPTVYQNQFFIVIKFTFGVGGGTDGWMWINPSIASPEPAADLTHDSSLASKSRSEFHAINFEASSNDRTPDCYIDELRVTGSWEEALGLPALSVSKNELSNSVKLYPNPASDYLVVETGNVDLSSVELFNVVGSKVLSTNTNRLDVSGLTKGIYFAKINADGASITKKIILE